MIRIEVKEKNGSPKELVFDKDIVIIGRSAKSDVILPRSNVSKKHVSIKVTNENCVVTDMGSTNGTFVNGQKIGKPVSVSPEDKIFVSDFILKARYEDDEIPEELSGIHEIMEPMATNDLDAETLGGNAEELIRTLPPGGEANPSREPSPPPEPPESIHDYETKKITLDEKERELRGPAAAGSSERAPTRNYEKKHDEASPGDILTNIFKQIDEYLQLKKQEIHSLGSEDFMKKCSRVIAEVLDAAVDSGGLPRNLEPRELSERLQSELLGLGPIDAYLSEPTVGEVSILPSGELILFTDDGAKNISDPFISPESRHFVLRKLIFLAGAAVQEGDPIITGAFKDGTTVKMISHPISVGGTTVSIRKQPALDSISMETLVEKDFLSAKMAKLLEYCLQMRKGILIADPLCLSHRTLMPALASILPQWERIAIVQCGNESVHSINSDMYFNISSESSEVFTLSKSGESLYSVIPSLQPTAIFAGEISSAQLLKVARISSHSKTAVIATVREPGPLDIIERLKQMMFNEYPELDVEGMSRMATEGFSLVVCYSKMMDRSEKVTLMSDIQFGKDGKINLKPIFYYDMKKVGSAGDIAGTFRSTKAIPAFIEEKRQRGLQIDTSIFQ